MYEQVRLTITKIDLVMEIKLETLVKGKRGAFVTRTVEMKRADINKIKGRKKVDPQKLLDLDLDTLIRQ